MKSIDRAQLYSLTGLALGVTFGGAGAGTAKIFANGRIVISLTTGAASGQDITLTTPVAFTVRDIKSIHANATASAWTLKNGSNGVTAAVAVANSDNDIDRAVGIINAEYAFLEDDDDLVLTISTAAFLGDFVIDIDFD